MNPAIWSKLPYDLLECIASFADIESRRALGFKPRKLPKTDLKICSLPWKQADWGWSQIMGPNIIQVGKAILNSGEVRYFYRKESTFYFEVFKYD